MSVRLNQEYTDAHNASGMSLLFDASIPKPLTISLGLSANEVKSDLDLARSGRKKIHPVYGIAKISYGHTISPFFEIGVDVGDVIIDDFKEFINSLGDNSEASGEAIDVYFSLGLTLKASKKFAVSLYRKRYNINFYDISNPTLQKVDLDLTGVSFSYYIK